MIARFRFLWTQTRYKKQIIFLILLFFSVGIANAAFSWRVGYAVQTGMALDIPESIRMLLTLGLIGLLRCVLQYAANLLAERTRVNMDLEYRSAAISRLVKKDFSAIQKDRSGDLLNRVQTSLEHIPVLLEQAAAFISDGLTLLVLFAVLLGIDWRMAVGFAAVMPLFVWLQKKLMEFSELFEPYIDDRAALDARALDMLTHRSTIKSYGLFPVFLNKLNVALAKQKRSGLSASYHVFGAGSLPEAVVAAGSLLVYLAALFALSQGKMTAGAAVGALLITQMISAHMSDLTNISINLPVNLAYVDTLRGIMEMPDNRAGTGRWIPGAFAVSVEGVSFTYGMEDEKTDYALRGISLTVKAGEHVAFVGASGSGKSTLLKVLAGLYEVQEGCVRIGGISVKEWDLKSLSSYMAIVSQEPFLFHADIRENIRCVKPEASDEEVEAAAKKAGLLPFIQSQPEGFRTMLEEQGANLSGGQRQRITLARAFLKRPQVLFIDEGTSALDANTEKEIYDGLALMMEGKTVLTVSHRLSAIMNADRIFVVDKGGIAEEGTHEELLNKGGVYAALWNGEEKTDEGTDA